MRSAYSDNNRNNSTDSAEEAADQTFLPRISQNKPLIKPLGELHSPFRAVVPPFFCLISGSFRAIRGVVVVAVPSPDLATRYDFFAIASSTAAVVRPVSRATRRTSSYSALARSPPPGSWTVFTAT
jgi:hypothetical protein